MTQTNSSFVFLSFFSLIMLFSACQKEESSPMTEEEAVEIVEASLQKKHRWPGKNDRGLYRRISN
jgi:hypothetical protein